MLSPLHEKRYSIGKRREKPQYEDELYKNPNSFDSNTESNIIGNEKLKKFHAPTRFVANLKAPTVTDNGQAETQRRRGVSWLAFPKEGTFSIMLLLMKDEGV